MYYVYLLESRKDSSYYIGQTEDVQERLARHNAGLVLSTRARLPWNLIGYEEHATREDARFREYTLKRNFSEKKKYIKKVYSQSSENIHRE